MDMSPDRSTPVSKFSLGSTESNYITRNNSQHSVFDNSNKPCESLPTNRKRMKPTAALSSIVEPPPMIPANNGASGTSSSSESPSDSTIGFTGGETPKHDPGPSTPLLSENMDPHAPPLYLEQPVQRKMECLGSYSSVVGGGMQHSPCPMLTPSLVNYVQSELTSHVNGWPADILEKRAKKFTEKAYQLGCLQCTRVSSELKCFRAIVRHKVIQATLQEQKILYVRQQISWLEELKPKNSFMSED